MAEEKMKKCPFCGEEILEVAIKCKHCKEDLAENATVQNDSKEKKKMSWTPLLYVLTSIFLLAIIAFVFIRKNYENEKAEKQVQDDLKEIVKLLISYKDDPTNGATLPESLEQIDGIKIDPWGKIYVYKNTARTDDEPFTLFSAGPNGLAGDKDDIYMNDYLINSFVKNYFKEEPKEVKSEKSAFFGVGIILREPNDEDIESVGKYPVIERTMKDSPASKNEVLQDYLKYSGNFLVGVDGKSTKNLSVDDTYKLLNGKEGTKVKISIETSIDGVDIEIIRGTVGN